MAKHATRLYKVRQNLPSLPKKNQAQQHTRSDLSRYPIPDERFSEVNVDIVGPFPPCDGWFSRFGTPVRLTSDRGRQFTSALFTQLCQVMGTNQTMTTAYHPQFNGLVKRFHRTLKAAINCQDSTHWVKNLPLILLGLRTTIKEDVGATPAQLVYGTTLRLPADFLVSPKDPRSMEDFVKEIRQAMQRLKPAETTWHGQQKPFVNKDLATSSHVFVRNDSVKSSITPPYEGPFEVISRSEKFFGLKINGRQSNVSIDRLKPAFLEQEDPLDIATNEQSAHPNDACSESASHLEPPQDLNQPRLTRVGRRHCWGAYVAE